MAKNNNGPGGFGQIPREGAYRIAGHPGFGDVYIQICARVWFSEEETGTFNGHSVKKGEFLTTQRKLCELTAKNHRTLKIILQDLITLGLISVEKLDSCLRIKLFVPVAPVQLGVAPVQRPRGSSTTRGVAPVQLGCGSSTTLKNKGSKRIKGEGGEEGKVPPPQSNFSSLSNLTGLIANQDKPPEDAKALSLDAIALGEDWYGWLAKIVPSPGLNVSEFHKGCAEIIDNLKGDISKARRVFEFIKGDQKMSRLFISPSMHSKNFGGMTYLNDVLLKIQTPKKAEVKTDEDIKARVMKLLKGR